MIYKIGMKFNVMFKITEFTFQGFVNLFNDRNPLHTDEQFAIDKGFKGKVMHGSILSGFISYFIGECLPTNDIIIHSLDIKFINPVYLKDELKFEALINNIYEPVNAVEFKYSFTNTSSKIVARGKFQIGLLE